MDLHVHTTFSDGSCSIHDACAEAIKKEISLIAISDHFTTTWKNDFIKTLSFEDLPGYFNQIKEAQALFTPRILAGIEIDCESDWSKILQLPLEKFDLINFEYVNTAHQLKKIISLRETASLASKPFILAHNNGRNLEKFVDQLFQYDISVELNSRYAEYFLQEESTFRILIKKGITFSIGSDAHDVRSVGEIKPQYAFLERLNGTSLIISP